MIHVKRFQGIPMSKSMRSLCKEEDYAFLGMSESKREGPEATASLEDDWRHKKEERVRWQLEREQQEKDRQRELEERKKEKEEQWRAHVAELTSTQEKTLQDRLTRLRRFREFQRKVLEEEGMIAGLTVDQLLTRM
ncbi:matrix metalloproteinase-2 [Parambassis ranga]|uniref:Matrix metalloproteinase-2 n=1 Tax=Parambassis ranga TaxID=210632 RepID=A0A6P7JHY2_9TELE|nr:matrix metalloproteinase-2-like [Parambassis ranga]